MWKLCGTVVIYLLAVSPTLPAQSSQPSGLAVHYEFRHQSISLHEPAVLIFSAHNNLTAPVTLKLGSAKTQFFQFSLRSPDGEVLRNIRNPGDNVSIAIFGTGTATVAPGGDYRQAILLNQWFTFEAVGAYFLTIRLTSPAEMSGEATVPISEGTAWLQVTPRDPEKLRATCSLLAKKVENIPSVEEWQLPARMLASINDPIAVPFLRDVLATNKGTENIIVPALERIGDDESAEVLLSALNDKSGEVADLARQALARVKNRVSKPSLKHAIEEALSKKAKDPRV